MGAIHTGLPLVLPLLLGLAGFVLVARRRGFPLSELASMAVAGAKTSLIVIRIFVLIGAITAVWRACGTVACIVYYGIALLNADYFILFAFLLSCLVSFLLGTSFGTVGTVGVILMVLARGGGVDGDVAAGAIIAGAYFGDRCSPMSSSAALVAALTATDIHTNIRNMLSSTALPLGLAVIGYTLLSSANPLIFQGSGIADEIRRTFDISPPVLLPALIVLAAAFWRVDVKLSMGISILAGGAIGCLLQHQTPLAMVGYILSGYSPADEGFFAGIIKGGGLISMVNAALIVLISSAYSGIFAGTGLLREVEDLCGRAGRRLGAYPATLLTGLGSAAFACNQTLAVMLTHQFATKLYEQQRLSRYRLALDLENTVIVISALIPWNIAGAFPAATLGAGPGFIPFAFYLFLVPLVSLRWIREA